MSASYEVCLKQVLAYEGGKVDLKADPGGRTNKGVTQKVFKAWLISEGKANRDVFTITDAEVSAIYRQQYWNAVKGDDLPAGVDLAVFDYGVNSGPAQATKAIQRIVGVEADGIMGVKTLAAIRNFRSADLANQLCDARLRFMRGLKTWKTFGKGWSARVAHVRVMAVKMAGGVSAVAPAPAGGQETASPKDTKVSATPAGKGTITATIGTAGAAIGAAKDSLSPLTGNGGFVDTVFTVLVVGGSLAAIAGLAVVAYQQMKHREAAA